MCIVQDPSFLTYQPYFTWEVESMCLTFGTVSVQTWVLFSLKRLYFREEIFPCSLSSFPVLSFCSVLCVILLSVILLCVILFCDILFSVILLCVILFCVILLCVILLSSSPAALYSYLCYDGRVNPCCLTGSWQESAGFTS